MDGGPERRGIRPDSVGTTSEHRIDAGAGRDSATGGEGAPSRVASVQSLDEARIRAWLAGEVGLSARECAHVLRTGLAGWRATRLTRFHQQLTRHIPDARTRAGWWHRPATALNGSPADTLLRGDIGLLFMALPGAGGGRTRGLTNRG
jgi:hypothetical protein